MTQFNHPPTVLIFGATGGIGSALARQLGKLGYGMTLVAHGTLISTLFPKPIKKASPVIFCA